METRSIIYISAEVIVGLVSVIGNAVVLAAILRTRQLHTVTNVFVGNLAIADIAVGLLVAPCAALSYKGLPKDFYGCVLINCAILLLTNVSILMLLAVALERFLAIKEPYVYQRLMTVRRAVLINLAVWLLGTILGLMPMYGWNSGQHDLQTCQFTLVITYEYMVYFQFFGLVLLPLFLMLCVYAYILVIVRRHMRQTSALHRQFQHNHAENGANNNGRKNSGSRRGGKDGGEGKENNTFNKDVRAAKMFALVILMFAVFWLPVNIFNCVSLFCGTGCPFPIDALLVAIVMSHANSSINPFVYAASNSRIKRAIRQLFGADVGQDDLSTDINNPGGYRTGHGVTRHREPTAVRDNTILDNDSSNHKGNVNNYNSISQSNVNGFTERESEKENDTSGLGTSKTIASVQTIDATTENASLSSAHPLNELSRPSSHEDVYPMVTPCSQHLANDEDEVYELQPYNTEHVQDRHVLEEGHDQFDGKMFFKRRTTSPEKPFPLLSFPFSTQDSPNQSLVNPYSIFNTENPIQKRHEHNSVFPPSKRPPKNKSKVSPQTPRRNTLPALRPSFITQQDNFRRSFQNARGDSNSNRVKLNSVGCSQTHGTQIGHTNPAFSFEGDSEVDDNRRHSCVPENQDCYTQSKETFQSLRNDRVFQQRHYLQELKNEENNIDRAFPSVTPKEKYSNSGIINQASSLNDTGIDICSNYPDDNAIFHTPTVSHIIPVKTVTCFDRSGGLRSPPLTFEIEEGGLLRSKRTEHTKL